jgi:hypothetical protein
LGLVVEQADRPKECCRRVRRIGENPSGEDRPFFTPAIAFGGIFGGINSRRILFISEFPVVGGFSRFPLPPKQPQEAYKILENPRDLDSRLSENVHILPATSGPLGGHITGLGHFGQLDWPPPGGHELGKDRGPCR